MNRVLFMQLKLQPAAHKDTFCRIDFAYLVTIATPSGVFIENRVNWLLDNQNKAYTFLVLLL